MANNCDPPLERQSSLPPNPKTPNREVNRLTRDATEEFVFSAVAAAMEMHYDEEIVLYAITGEKPAKAENANSKKLRRS